MVSLAVGCSTLFVITVYISGVESEDADTVRQNARKKEVPTEHDISVFFRPILGKRGSFYIPRLGKRDPDGDDSAYPFWNIASDGSEMHERDSYQDQLGTAQNPLLMRLSTPRQGRRSSYFVPRLGKRLKYFIPRLGKRDVEDNNLPYTLWETEEVPDYDAPRERRGDRNDDKIWKTIGMFNPRLGRSVQSDIVFDSGKDDSKHNVNLSLDRE